MGKNYGSHPQLVAWEKGEVFDEIKSSLNPESIHQSFCYVQDYILRCKLKRI
jgi:hypothetical protein